jgi:hypothetical protein
MCSVVSPTVNATPSKVPSSVTEVDIEGLKMCDNCGKANNFPIQYAPARHMIVQPFVDID